MKFPVVDLNQKEVGSVEADILPHLSAEALTHTCYLYNRKVQAEKRAGTASTLTKSEVSGGGRKPYRQKGTGGARRGSNRTPLRPGGGVSFGPKPRGYGFKLNSKVVLTALKAAFALKQDALNVVSVSGDAVIKTKQIITFLKGKSLAPQGKALFIVDQSQDFLLESAVRNLSNSVLLNVRSLDVQVILNAEHVLISEAAFAVLKERGVL
jgi:large subunit ribosomal protein L4